MMKKASKQKVVSKKNKKTWVVPNLDKLTRTYTNKEIIDWKREDRLSCSEKIKLVLC